MRQKQSTPATATEEQQDKRNMDVDKKDPEAIEDEEDDEEMYDDDEGDEQGIAANSMDDDAYRRALRSMLDGFNKEQMGRYEAFRRAGLPKASIKKVLPLSASYL